MGCRMGCLWMFRLEEGGFRMGGFRLKVEVGVVGSARGVGSEGGGD